MKLPSGITRLAGRQMLVLKKNSPHIMFGAGIASGITATVLACQATLKLSDTMLAHEEDRKIIDEALEDPKSSYNSEQHAKESRIIQVRIVRDLTKLYAPAVGVGVISIALLSGAHVTLTKRNAALAAAYGILDKSYREYRERVIAEFGEDKDRELAHGVVEKEIVEEGEHGHEVKTVKRAKGKHSDYARIFDENNRCWSNSSLDNRAFLMAQQNYLNDLLQSRGHVLLNDVYDLLKMERSKAGAVVGWVKESEVGDNFIDFGLFNSADPVIRDFMNLEHNDGIMLDFNVDGVVYELIKRTY